jgi:hypothetical protein
MKSSRFETVLDAVTATTESDAIDIKYARRVTLTLTRAANAGGTSTFSVTGSVDGTNYVDIYLITNVATTNAQTVVRAANVAIANTNGSVIAALDLEFASFKYIKVTVTETADGTHSASLFIEE